MAGRLNPFFSPLCLSIWSLAWIGPTCAQTDASLPDPTRPPPTANETAATGAQPAPSPDGGLQTIILAKGHKPRAVINGVMLELGDKLGDATLVKLNESEAVLQGPAGREVLYLLPGMVKKTQSAGHEKVDGLNHEK